MSSFSLKHVTVLSTPHLHLYESWNKATGVSSLEWFHSHPHYEMQCGSWSPNRDHMFNEAYYSHSSTTMYNWSLWKTKISRADERPLCCFGVLIPLLLLFPPPFLGDVCHSENSPTTCSKKTRCESFKSSATQCKPSAYQHVTASGRNLQLTIHKFFLFSCFKLEKEGEEGEGWGHSRTFEVSENKLCQAFFRLRLAKSESKRADNLPFHLSEAVKERTVSCHGCELVQLSTVKATIFFSEGRPLSVFFPL